MQCNYSWKLLHLGRNSGQTVSVFSAFKHGGHSQWYSSSSTTHICLNDHNINDVFETILKSEIYYQKYNLNTDDTYCAIETANHWSLVHNATSHWVKEVNTVFLKAVDIHFDNGLWKVNPNIQYLLELFVISSNNQIMYKLLFILFINIFKVPFDMKQVPGSLTGEVLFEELISQISQVTTVKNIVASAISEAFLSISDDDAHEDQLEQYCK